MNIQPMFKETGNLNYGEWKSPLRDAPLLDQDQPSEILADTDRRQKLMAENLFGFEIQPVTEPLGLQLTDTFLNRDGTQTLLLPAPLESDFAQSRSYERYQWTGVIFTSAIVFLITGVIAGLFGLSGVPWLSLDMAKVLYLTGLVAGLLFLVLADELRPVSNQE